MRRLAGRRPDRRTRATGRRSLRGKIEHGILDFLCTTTGLEDQRSLDYPLVEA